MEARSDPKVEIMERGDIFFFYRPKVDKEEAHSLDDIQRLYIVLRPESGGRVVEEKQASDSGKEGKSKTGSTGKSSGKESAGGHGKEECIFGAFVSGGAFVFSRRSFKREVTIEKQPLMRVLIIGKKKLPDPSKKRRPYWGYVDLVTTDIEDVKAVLKGGEYETLTRGRRRKPPARALDEGVYQILRHESRRTKDTHLIYKPEFPLEFGDDAPQVALNVEREASFLIQIKNPNQGASYFTGLNQKPAFPAELQERFGQRRYCPADPPDFLNYKGCEFLLISASDDSDHEELGLDVKTEPLCLDVLHLFGDVYPKPLLMGKWA